MSKFKSITKAGVGMFAVGALLTFAAQVIAPGLGLETDALTFSAATGGNPLWIGAYFGAFGAISAAVAPVVDYLFGEDKKEPVKAVAVSQEKSQAPELQLEQAQGKTINFCEKIEAERSVAAIAQNAR